MRVETSVPCPRCGFRRVVQRGQRAYVCFQCRYAWSFGAEPPPQPPPSERTLDAIPERLWPRLIAYRGAILAGVYTDWPGKAKPRARLNRVAQSRM
jgi:hypothetical protein